MRQTTHDEIARIRTRNHNTVWTFFFSSTHPAALSMPVARVTLTAVVLQFPPSVLRHKHHKPRSLVACLVHSGRCPLPENLLQRRSIGRVSVPLL